ncbi:hypothetical protein [Alkalilimnicola sp. S0819]|uniref:hypothetical protein n=1 Tax=Alkalilimnicola sp. S0819 TaxID=2613922 RepID=UPI0012618AB5|nr:hypothetical protein [Alkalilimnicola sp. S0819]KAB7628240.1 UDP-N-acetyl glucosamine 2-epimerase [Alkalilimnicola sp. S0819]MPQ15131.1 hypothetical protein [Alkalilimnicola sp. S0819]
MSDWIANRRVLAAFGDPAGAKAVLAYLSAYGRAAATITAVSDRKHGFYEDFDCKVQPWPARAAQDWLKDKDILLTGTSVPTGLELELIESAARVEVPSISFVDHWTNMAARFQSGARRILPDRIAVIDEQAGRVAHREGLPAERVCVVGNPYHEYLRAWRPKVAMEGFLASIGVDPAVPYLLYAPEPLSSFNLDKTYGFDELDGLRLLIKARRARGRGDVAIVVKGHPNQHHALFERELAATAEQNLVYVREADFNLLAHGAAAVIGFFSNSMIEARLLGRPVIRLLSLLRAGAADPLAGWREGGWTEVYTDHELVDALAAALDDIRKN